MAKKMKKSGLLIMRHSKLMSSKQVTSAISTPDYATVKFQRKRIKIGTMPKEQMRLFQELEGMRSGILAADARKKKNL